MTENRTGLRKTMILNTVSNYGNLIMKLAVTLVLTRVLFLGLTRQEYGFWALLWTIFGYSLLLDFGFGVSVQKYTSEVMVSKDWDKYNRLVSTVFFNYCGMSLLIIVGTLGLAPFLNNLFSFEAGSAIHDYQKVFLGFGIGTAFVFPFGFFTEILRGMQKITLRNMVSLGFTLVSFVLMIVMVKMGYSLMGMTIVTITCNLATNLVMGYLCFRNIPQLRISLKYYSRKLLKDVMGFSLFAYIIMFSNLIIFRTDQLVISVLGSISLVGIYQIASRLADTYRQFSTQFHDNLGPVASMLFTSGDKDKLKEILLQSNRLVGFIATFMFIPLVVYIKPILEIWLKLKDPDGVACAIILMISMYVLVVLRTTTVQVLLMCNKYRSLTWVAIIECVSNLVLSIILMRRIGITGVAWGTLIPNVVLAFAYNIPAACRFAGIPVMDYLKKSLAATLGTGIITLGVAVGLYLLRYPGNLLWLGLYGSVVCLVFLGLFYRMGLYKWERVQFQTFLSTKLRKS